MDKRIIAAVCAGGLLAGCSSHQPVVEIAPAPRFIEAGREPAADLSVNPFGEVGGATPVSNEVGGEAVRQHTYTEEGGDSTVTLSPDGQWIVFASTRNSDNSSIYLQRVDGLSVTQLTSDRADDAFPTFSPDGKSIAFASTRGGNWDLYCMDADGRNAVQITSGPSQDLHPSFSPDGKRLVYSSMPTRGGQWELWTIDLATGSRSMIGFGLFPTWCPDASVDRIAFQRARQRGSRWFGVWTLDLINGQATRITEVASSSNAALVSPTWSPDGQRLAFATIMDPIAADTKRGGGQTDVWTIKADGANRRRLTDGRGVNGSPVWARDGRVYFISSRGGCETIWSALAEGAEAVAVKPTTPVAPATMMEVPEREGDAFATPPTAMHTPAAVARPVAVAPVHEAVEAPLTTPVVVAPIPAATPVAAAHEEEKPASVAEHKTSHEPAGHESASPEPAKSATADVHEVPH